ncbi:hypothetical protein [Botrimarina sp.]
MPFTPPSAGLAGDPDWDFCLPDEDAQPEPGDFWIEPDEDDD